MSRFSEEVRDNFVDILRRDDIKDIEITVSRFPSSIFSTIFWNALADKLICDKEAHIIFHFPVTIDKRVFNKIDKALIDIIQFAFDYRPMISYVLTPWLNEDNNYRTLFSITGETTNGRKITFAMSKNVNE